MTGGGADDPGGAGVVRVALNGWFAGRAVGSGQYTDRLASALAAQPATDVTVVASRRRGTLAKLAFEQIGFSRAAQAGAADLAHVPYWAPPLLPTLPTVVTVHDLIPLLLPEYRRRAAVRAYVSLVARATPRAAAVIADSAHTARDIVSHLDVDPTHVHVVPLGVDVATPSPEAIAGVRARYGLPDRFGLYLGGFDVRKDLATLLAAWRIVHSATGVPLVVAGSLPAPNDPLQPHPLELSRQVGLSEIAWRTIGAVAEDDKPALYSAAALFAFPSRYEGFGLPPLEAMAAGTPVVAANATSLPEVVGEAGLLVAVGDVAAWADALRRLLEDEALAARCATLGLARVGELSWARTAEGTRAVYGHLRPAGG